MRKWWSRLLPGWPTAATVQFAKFAKVGPVGFGSLSKAAERWRTGRYGSCHRFDSGLPTSFFTARAAVLTSECVREWLATDTRSMNIAASCGKLCVIPRQSIKFVLLTSSLIARHCRLITYERNQFKMNLPRTRCSSEYKNERSLWKKKIKKIKKLKFQSDKFIAAGNHSDSPGSGDINYGCEIEAALFISDRMIAQWWMKLANSGELCVASAKRHLFQFPDAPVGCCAMVDEIPQFPNVPERSMNASEWPSFWRRTAIDFYVPPFSFKYGRCCTV